MCDVYSNVHSFAFFYLSLLQNAGIQFTHILFFSVAMKVANFSMLAFFIISVVVMLIRWFQVLTYRDKLGQNNLYYRRE